MFVGRNSEIKTINHYLNRDSLEAILIYGRRRIGKSELIKECLRTFDGKKIYYECREVSERNNIEGICDLISLTYNFPKPAFSSIIEVLKFFFEEGKKEKIVLVLDEYPYLKRKINGLDSIIQSLIDEYKNESRLKLILCGSQIEIMKSLLEDKNPLYGRLSLKLHIKQMDYYDSSLFYKDYSNEDKVMLYSVFGGVPYYNSLIDTSKSALENINDLLIKENARLETEINYSLKMEISKIENANAVFETIASGIVSFSDILSKSHVSSSPSLADTINKLLELELIEKDCPINNNRKHNYRISDNLSNFYYRYIFKNTSRRKIMSEKAFYEKCIEEDFISKYIPKCFERICKEYLNRENMKDHIEPVLMDIGRYYYDDPTKKINREFDVVSYDEVGYIAYECKYTKNPLTDKDLQMEIKQVDDSPLKVYNYGFFSKSGFKLSNKYKYRLYELKDIYK